MPTATARRVRSPPAGRRPPAACRRPHPPGAAPRSTRPPARRRPAHAQRSSRTEPYGSTMRWTVHGERSVYASPWVGLALVDVEIPDGDRFEHHVVRVPGPAVGAIVTDEALGVLLLWRHRFITDSWGWEIPAGGVDRG